MKPYLFVLFSGLALACCYETYQAYREHREMLNDPQWLRKQELKKQADKYLITGSPEHAKFLEDALKRPQATEAAIQMEGDARLPWRIKTVAEGFVSGKPDKFWTVSTLAVERLGLRSEDRANFVQSYASTFELMPAERAQEYQKLLVVLAENPDDWAFVKDDPVGLVILKHVSDPELRRYYRENREWLGDMLAQMSPVSPEDTERKVSAEDQLNQTLKAIKDFPEFKDLARSGRADAYTFATLLENKELIHEITRDEPGKLSPPLNEAIEVVFANPSNHRLSAANYLDVYRRPDSKVWLVARHMPQIVRLAKLCPDEIETLVEKYATDDVAGFLLMNFEDDTVQNAAKAIVLYGDLAFFVLQKYGSQISPKRELFHRLLKSHGPLVVPYTASYGDNKLDKLADDEGFLEKYFNKDGTPRKSNWYTAIPIIGAPTELIQNMANGYPTEWKDIGWAALDIADGALLVVSLGTSAEVTAFKQGVQVAAKEAATLTLKSSATKVGRAAAKRIGIEGMKTGATKTLLYRAAREAGEIALRIGKWTIIAPIKATTKTAELLKSLSPMTQRAVARALLAVGLTITLTERSLPKIEDQLTLLKNHLEELAGKYVEGIGKPLLDAIEAVLGTRPDWLTAKMAGWACGSLLFGVLSFATFPRRRNFIHV